MKIIYVTVLVSFLMNYAVKGAENFSPQQGVPVMKTFIADRINAFMAALKIESGSEKELPDQRKGGLSAQKFKSANTLAVNYVKECFEGSDGGTSVIEFLDGNGRTKGSARIIYEKSVRGAQLALFKSFVVNSLPLNIVIARYEVKVGGPGDLCIIEKVFDKGKQQYISDESLVHIIRGNVAISVNVKDPALKAETFAKTLDENLVGGMAKGN